MTEKSGMATERMTVTGQSNQDNGQTPSQIGQTGQTSSQIGQKRGKLKQLWSSHTVVWKVPIR